MFTDPYNYFDVYYPEICSPSTQIRMRTRQNICILYVLLEQKLTVANLQLKNV